MTHLQAANEIRFRLGIKALRDAGANVLADQLQRHLDCAHGELDEHNFCLECGNDCSAMAPPEIVDEDAQKYG